jgi:hypothetical protein
VKKIDAQDERDSKPKTSRCVHAKSPPDDPSKVNFVLKAISVDREREN